jgi:uncharacterized membrane protein YhaH (DUF805 family)
MEPTTYSPYPFPPHPQVRASYEVMEFEGRMRRRRRIFWRRILLSLAIVAALLVLILSAMNVRDAAERGSFAPPVTVGPHS